MKIFINNTTCWKKGPFLIVFNDYIHFVNTELIKANYNKPIFFWFLTLTIMTFIMIFIGGLTRLTDSGLSMVNWRPIMGTIPPLSSESWIKVFKSYQNSPEFLIINKNMNLSEFKEIFWWEWFHRFFARFIGIIFIIPLVFFIIKKKIKKKLFYTLLILLLFGFFQALVGWWMVKSGLNNDPYVSAYRLAFHLTNAIIIFTILLWLTLSSFDNISINFSPKNNQEIAIFFTIIFLFITIITGAFMAGSNSGQSFNTYPLMNGKFLPDDYFLFNNYFKNFFENTVAINFNHRWVATACFVFIILLTVYMKLIKKNKKHNKKIYLIIFFVCTQFFLGIMTLLTNVRIDLAIMHQANSILLLGSLINIYYYIKRKEI